MTYLYLKLLIAAVAAVLCIAAGSWKTACIILLLCTGGMVLCDIIAAYSYKKRISILILYLTKLQDAVILPDFDECRGDDLGILQSEIYKLVTLLKEQSDREGQQKRYLADMLSDISHQIKTPLTGITIMTDLLKNPDLPAEKRMEFVERIDSQTGKITWLIHNLLTLSQLEADVLKLKPEMVAAETVLTHAAAPLELLAEVRNVTLALECDAQICMYCDVSWTAEALSNIIKNCIEHTAEGGCVRTSVWQNNFSVNIRIEDNGCGIAKEDLPHIFERFYKGKHSAKDSIGIGLAMAKQVIMRQNGTIEAESVEGEGSRFLVKMYMK